MNDAVKIEMFKGRVSYVVGGILRYFTLSEANDVLFDRRSMAREVPIANVPVLEFTSTLRMRILTSFK